MRTLSPFIDLEPRQNEYALALSNGTTTDIVEVTLSHMDDWLLFECFFLPHCNVCYFGMVKDEQLPYLLGSDDECDEEK